MLAASFDESTMSRIQVQLRDNRFKEGREDANDNAQLSTTDENIQAVRKMILDNRWITIRELADDVAISFGSWQAIFKDVLGMNCEAAKFVSKFWAKTTSHGHCSGDVDDVQHRIRFA